MKEKKILNTLAKGAGLTAVGMLISKAITYFYRIAVGRFIGPEAYGQLSLGLAVIGITSVFVKLGLDDAIKNFVPKARERDDLGELKGIVLSSAQIISFSGLLIGSVVFFSADFIAASFFNSPSTAPIIRVFAFVPLFSRLASVFIDTTIGFNTIKYHVLTVRILQNVIQLLVTLVLIYFSFGVIGAAYGWLAGVVATIFIGFYFMERKLGPIIFTDEKPKYQHSKLLKYSYPLVLSGAVGTMLGWADTALLGYFMDDTAVGFYNAALPTALLVILPTQALGSLALPSMSELDEKEDGDPEEALKTLARWGFSLTFPAFLIMALFSSETLHLLFGREYAVAGTALAVLAFGNLFNAAAGQVGGFLKSTNHTKVILYSNVVSLVLNLSLNLLLIPRMGIVGAAIATASSTALFIVLLIAEAYRREGIHPFHPRMLRSVAAGLLSLGVTYFVFEQLSPNPYWILFPAGIVFFTIYVLTFLRIGGLTEYDREIVVTTGSKIGYEDETRRILDFLT